MKHNTHNPNHTKPTASQHGLSARARRIAMIAGATLAAATPVAASAKNAAPTKVDHDAPIATQERQMNAVMRQGRWFTVLNGKMLTHYGGRLGSVDYAPVNVKKLTPSLKRPLLTDSDTIGSLDRRHGAPTVDLEHYTSSIAIEPNESADNPDAPFFLRVKFPKKGNNGAVDFEHPVTLKNGHIVPLTDPRTNQPAEIGKVHGAAPKR